MKKIILAICLMFIMLLSGCSNAIFKNPSFLTNPSKTSSTTENSTNTKKISTTSKLNETVIYDLIQNNYMCIKDIFKYNSLPTEEKPIKDNLYVVTSDKFNNYKDFSDFILSIYSNETADMLLNNFPYENKQLYVNVDGKLCLNKDYIRASAYFVDWTNCKIKIINKTDALCKFEVIGTIEEPSDNPTKEEYKKEGTVLLEKGRWVLDSMIY